MKFLRFFTVLALSQLIFSLNVVADTSGYGCKINNDFVYTKYLGMATPYQGQPAVIYYDSNGPKVPIYWGWGCNDCRGYRCGYINVYGATSYYDPSIPPYGGMVNVPAENEFTFQNKPCAIAPSLNSQPVATDSYVYYSYNKTNKCGGTPPTNVPIDDHLWVLVMLTGMIGVYSFKKQIFA